jgi:hypothetical protein
MQDVLDADTCYTYLRLLWVSSVPPGKFRDSISIRRRQLIVNPFSVHHPLLWRYLAGVTERIVK